jgi:hypothetical protein
MDDIWKNVVYWCEPETACKVFRLSRRVNAALREKDLYPCITRWAFLTWRVHTWLSRCCQEGKLDLLRCFVEDMHVNLVKVHPYSYHFAYLSNQWNIVNYLDAKGMVREDIKRYCESLYAR